MGFNCEFHLPTISHQPFVRFSLKSLKYSSMSCYAELMTQLHRLKNKVTVQGHGFYPLNLVSAPYLLNPMWERSGSVVESLTRDRGAAYLIVTVLCP